MLIHHNCFDINTLISKEDANINTLIFDIFTYIYINNQMENQEILIR